VFAHELIQKLANYLECPPETMFYRKITKDLCSGERKWAVAQSFPRSEIIQANDGYWYFIVEFVFSSACVIDKFGVNTSGVKFLVRHAQRDHEIRRGKDDDFNKFFEYWYDATKKALSIAVTEPTARIRLPTNN